MRFWKLVTTELSPSASSACFGTRVEESRVLELPEGRFEGLFARAGAKVVPGSRAPAPSPEEVRKLMDVAPEYGLEIRG